MMGGQATCTRFSGSLAFLKERDNRAKAAIETSRRAGQRREDDLRSNKVKFADCGIKDKEIKRNRPTRGYLAADRFCHSRLGGI